MSKIKSRMLAALALALVLASTSMLTACSDKDREGTAYNNKVLLREAFDYTLPLVMLEATKISGTNVESDNGTGYAPLNQLGHCEYLLDASFKGVVTPNVDTVYSNSYMDIGEEPMVFTLPEADDRYMAAQIMDGWTNNVALLQDPGSYVFVKKGYSDELPSGVTKVELGTNNVWMVIRTLCNGQDDLENVHYLQSQMSLVPLSVYESGEIYVPEKGEVKEENNFVPVEYVMGLSVKEYFDMANSLMETNPPADIDKDILEKIAKLNIGPGCKFDESLVDEATWSEIIAEASERYEVVMKDNSVSIGQWGYLDDPIGNWGDEYEYRAAIALKAIGANSLATAVYATTYTDEEGVALKGNSTYRLHFEEFPPIGENGFWSVTAYGNDDFLIDNPLNRYCINDRSEVNYNDDGTLDIIISSEEPADNTSNWLPISDQDFHLYLRMYEPQLDKIQTWKAPVISSLDK